MARCDVMINAMMVMKTIEIQRGDFTISDIIRETVLHRRSVYRYFTAACIVMPIMEVGPCDGKGHPTAYRLVKAN